jgi:KaiC/GvpD/RAD55 family RecA-like ATPase
LEEVKRLTDELDKPVVLTEEIERITTDLELLAEHAVNQPGLRWRLDCLNKSLGSLRKGDFGFIFARPESGKTTFLASESSKMIDQSDKPVVWFNLEEQGEKVMLRFYQGYFGVTLDVLLANVKQYKKLFQEKVGDKFILVDNAGLTARDIERTLHSVQPSLIIYDQIDKIKGFKADREDLVYGAIYQWARELAKTYAPTIGVCQADGSAEGQKWLSMANVSNAKTSKQAEADWILGLGKTHEETAEYIRYINLSKNKLMGDKDSIPSLRHGRFEVVIRPEIARYSDIVKYE